MKLLSILFLTLFMSSASAFIDQAGTVTDLEQVNYWCAADGGGIAISVDLERVWQIDSPNGALSGLELEVTDFSLARCPHCMSINANLNIFGEKLGYKINIRPEDKKIFADITVGDGEDEMNLNYECKFSTIIH